MTASDLICQLDELATYILQRGEASSGIAKTTDSESQRIRCNGKAEAYAHAAELVKHLGRELSSEQSTLESAP